MTIITRYIVKHFVTKSLRTQNYNHRTETYAFMRKTLHSVNRCFHQITGLLGLEIAYKPFKKQSAKQQRHK